MHKPSPATVIALVALFVALGGVGVAATGGNFILGQSNSADKTTALNVSTLPSGCAAPCQALQVSDTSTASNAGGLGVLSKSASTPAATIKNTGGATALNLLVNSGKPPFTINSPTKVTNLNADQLDNRDSAYFLPTTGTAADSAKLGGQLPSYYLPKTGKAADADKLDGIDSTGFLADSVVRRIGPITASAGTTVTLATIGQFSFVGECFDGGFDQFAELRLVNSIAHAAYANIGFNGSNSDAHSDPDLAANSSAQIEFLLSPSGSHRFGVATGEALAARGDQLSYSLYLGQNARGQTGCVFGGSFVVK
jgi:hypothetical protein